VTAVRDETSGYLFDKEPVRTESRRQLDSGKREARFSHNADMAIHRCYSLVCTGLQKLAGDDLLHGQDHAILASDADSRSSILDCFDCILDLSRESCLGFWRASFAMMGEGVLLTWKFRPSGENTELERS